MKWTWVALAFAASASAAEPVRIGVTDFDAAGASPGLASAASASAAAELDRLGIFQVSTAEALRALLAHARQAQLLGCDSDTCAAGLSVESSLLGVQYLITGKVTLVPGGKEMPATFTCQLALLDVRAGKRQGSSIQIGRTEAEVLGKLRRAVIKLVQPLLSGRQGTLLVSSAESGASVKVDETTVGTTPIQGPLALAAGPHMVQLEKQGFVAAEKEVRIQPGQLTDETFTLVPSPDFIKEYESGATKMRVGAWIASAVAVAGIGTFAAFQLRANSLYGSPETPNTFQYDRQQLEQGVEISNGVDQRAQIQKLSTQITTSQNLSFAGAAVGAAGAAAAAFFWIAGDDPGRYRRFRDAPSLQLAPAPGGAHASLSFQF